MQKRLIALLVLMLVGAGSAAAATTRPQNTVLPTISGAAKQGEVLTAEPGAYRRAPLCGACRRSAVVRRSVRHAAALERKDATLDKRAARVLYARFHDCLADCCVPCSIPGATRWSEDSGAHPAQPDCAGLPDGI